MGYDAAPGAQHEKKRLLDIPEDHDLFPFAIKYHSYKVSTLAEANL